MATYINDLRVTELATGEASGSWGTTTNVNLELLAEAMGVGAEAVANASTHTITMADGATDQFRSTFLRLTGGGQACTVTLAPNTISHTWIMRNETAAALTLTQGSGANVTIAAGQTKIVATDGGGSGAIVYEMDDLELAGNLAVTGALTVDTNTLVVDATNNRVGIGATTVNRKLEVAGNNNGGAKANYIRITDTDTTATADNQAGGIEFFTNDVTPGIAASIEVLYAGTGGGGEITFNTNASSSGTLTEALRINESGNVSVAGDIDVDGTSNLDVVDIDGAVNMATTALVTGVLTTTAATVFNGGFASNAASTITTADNLDTLSLISTDADANAGPNLRMFRNSASPADSDTLGVIEFEGNNDAGSTVRYAGLTSLIADASDGTEDGILEIRTTLAGSHVRRIDLGTSETVFNEDSKDLDFRVESDNHASALFVNGADGNVTMQGATTTIGSAAASTNVELTLNGVASKAQRIAFNEGGVNRWLLGQGAASETSAFELYNATGVMALSVDRTTNAATFNGPLIVNPNTAGKTTFSLSTNAVNDARLQMKSDTTVAVDIQANGATVFNENGLAANDFRVESDGNANALFVDASADVTYIGKNTGALGTVGFYFAASTGNAEFTGNGSTDPLRINRLASDGTLINFYQATSPEGSISVSGSTVSYNGFAGRHESSGIATTTAKGTVVSTIDELDEYLSGPRQGQTRADHAKVKVSNTVGDARVYGVVDDFTDEGKLNTISVGIGSIKVTGACAGGDLLESNGDGTAKVQADDIIRSKTIGKVTIGDSNTGVKLVSCVLYCG
jgi:hypothetical protein